MVLTRLGLGSIRDFFVRRGVALPVPAERDNDVNSSIAAPLGFVRECIALFVYNLLLEVHDQLFVIRCFKYSLKFNNTG